MLSKLYSNKYMFLYHFLTFIFLFKMIDFLLEKFISVCVNTETLAAEPTPKKNTEPILNKFTKLILKKNKEPKPEKIYPT
ncbi:hypothetical protein [Plasmodium yoelii yoelii]|uniref:Uncharacterized protein n=1 Tax=Plasmodium yoelii yoelii TaxID=73239 RepID=Q7RM29_PLAYO|nr:hypothetical protein [Plasmodium yoelii yoelii]